MNHQFLPGLITTFLAHCIPSSVHIRRLAVTQVLHEIKYGYNSRSRRKLLPPSHPVEHAITLAMTTIAEHVNLFAEHSAVYQKQWFSRGNYTSFPKLEAWKLQMFQTWVHPHVIPRRSSPDQLTDYEVRIILFLDRLMSAKKKTMSQHLEWLDHEWIYKRLDHKSKTLAAFAKQRERANAVYESIGLWMRDSTTTCPAFLSSLLLDTLPLTGNSDESQIDCLVGHHSTLKEILEEIASEVRQIHEQRSLKKEKQ